MTKQLDKDMMRMMSLKDRMKYKADMDQMKRDIAKVKLEQSESKADVDGSHYSDMPSPEAYSQSNEALIARHKNKLSSEFQKQDEIDVHSDYIFDLVKGMSKEQYVKFFLDMDFGFALSDKLAFTDHILLLDYDLQLDVIKSALQATGELDIAERIGSDIGIKVELDEPTSSNPDPAGYGNTFFDLNPYYNGIKNDSDHDIRSTAQYYEEILNKPFSFDNYIEILRIVDRCIYYLKKILKNI